MVNRLACSSLPQHEKPALSDEIRDDGERPAGHEPCGQGMSARAQDADDAVLGQVSLQPPEFQRDSALFVIFGVME